jgi:hypothetical protein
VPFVIDHEAGTDTVPDAVHHGEGIDRHCVDLHD